MEGLEDDADRPAAEARKRVFAELPQILAGDRDGAGVRPFQPGHHHEQGGFARARWSEQAEPSLAAAYIQADISQDMDAAGAAAEREIDGPERDGVGGGRMARNVVHVGG